MKGRESSPVIWEGPPTDKDERSGKVKDTGGSFLGEKKGLKGGKLENCRRMPVHPNLILLHTERPGPPGENLAKFLKVFENDKKRKLTITQ